MTSNIPRYATGPAGVCFLVEEADTGKLWAISPEERYAHNKALSIAKTMDRDMMVFCQDKTGRKYPVERINTHF